MIKILQINAVSNYGSTGKIIKAISKEIENNGWESHIAYGRDLGNPDKCDIRIGNKLDNYFHLGMTRITDLHGQFSYFSTIKIINKIKKIKPDIIHLHNLHGYYINYPKLFSYIEEENIPIVWTLHDCWSFTGHCAHFEYVNCYKWKEECKNCIQTHRYPKSLIDNSKKNFLDKKNHFTKPENMIIVPVSDWLEKHLKNSFLGFYKSRVIKNGIDLSLFKINLNNRDIIKKYNLEDKKIALAVASVWDDRKGLKDLLKIAERLPKELSLIIVGLTKKQISVLPMNIIGIERTESIDELVALYNRAFVFVNPTLEDTYPTTNLEAMACGTPVITYETGGSPECINADTGAVVPKNDYESMSEEIIKYSRFIKNDIQEKCRKRAENLFDQTENFKKYIEVYKEVLNISK